jgi:DNA-directed RNA polymerase specialized sigma24 family protein
VSPAQDLIARLKAGDKAAFNEWIAQHKQELTVWTDEFVGVRPGHGGDASDVFGTFAGEMWKSVPAWIQTGAELLTWARTTLRRRAIDLARKRLLVAFPAQSDEAGSGATSFGPRIPIDQTTASQRAMRNEREQYILNQFTRDEAGLLDIGAVVVLLRQVDGILLKAIAGELGLDPVDVARRYYAALAPIRPGLDRLILGDRSSEPDTRDEQALRAVARLDPVERCLVELCSVDRFSVDEAVQVVNPTTGANLTTGAAAKRLSRVLITLRQTHSPRTTDTPETP